MRNAFKQLGLIRSTTNTSVVTPQLQACALVREMSTGNRLKGTYISHRSLSCLEDRAEYYSSLCSQHRINPNKKTDIISEIKLRIARITARKSVDDKQKPQKKKVASKRNLNCVKIYSPSFKVSQEILVEKPNKRKIIKT